MKRFLGISLVSLALTTVFGSYSLKKENRENKAEPVIAAPVSGNVAPPPYNIGDAVKDFSLKNVNGKMVSLASYPSARGFVLVFTCNHCPFSKSYEDRLIDLNKEYAVKGYPVIAINPNDPEAYEEDSFDNMKARSEEKNYPFPYLSDDKQVLCQAFGAQRTPQAFVLKKEEGRYILRYSGAIDDNPQDAAGVSKAFVRDALNYLIENKPVVTQTSKAVGCAVKWRN